MFNLILFGPPGAGKGTQAGKLAGKFGWKHISTGDILREEIKRGTALGLEVKSAMDCGQLVPDELLIEIMESVFLTDNLTKGYVLDGFPRTIHQAEELDKMLNKYGQKVSQVISLEVNEEELVHRLLKRALEQGRKDDTEEVIKNRLLQYHQHTKPLIEYYKAKRVFNEVHGLGTIDDIFKSICSIIVV